MNVSSKRMAAERNQTFSERYRDNSPNLSGPIYPLSGPLIVTGVFLGIVAIVLLQSIAVGTGFIVLFSACGLTWRRDMPPIIPFCLAYQWVGAHVGAIQYQIYGEFPGGGNPGNLSEMLFATQLGMICLTLGLRTGMHIFRNSIDRKLSNRPLQYNVSRLTQLTVVMFVSSYIVDAAPTSIWFGGAQIINNLLTLRFLPYFVLLLVVFERRSGYRLLSFATFVVLMPQLLTGFSDFKEIFFIVLLSLLYQWRPWIRSSVQRRRNFQVASSGLIGGVAIIAFGLVWAGGVKEQWRQELWNGDNAVDVSPIDRMVRFSGIVGEVVTELDIEQASQSLAARLSSGSLYFSYTLHRVPAIVPHEEGELLGRAVSNAILPRFLFPNKEILGGDSWLVRAYAGIEAAGDESGASIGLGYMPEFYIDFGYPGIVTLCFFYGFLLTISIWIFSKVAPSGPICIALIISLFIHYFTVFDASFIKIFAGLIQQTIICSAAIYLFAPSTLKWVRSPHSTLNH